MDYSYYYTLMVIKYATISLIPILIIIPLYFIFLANNVIALIYILYEIRKRNNAWMP